MKTLVWLLLLVAAPVAAQPSLDSAARNTFRWDNHTHDADLISTWAVVGALAAPCLLDREWQCVKNEALRVGVATGLAMVTKALVKRQRPDGSENVSFFSQHTAIACAATMHTKVVALCPAVGYLRIAADKHWLSDTVVGGVVGGLTVNLSW